MIGKFIRRQRVAFISSEKGAGGENIWPSKWLVSVLSTICDQLPQTSVVRNSEVTDKRIT